MRELLLGEPVFHRETEDVLEVADVPGHEQGVVHRRGRGEDGVGHLDRFAVLAQRALEVGGRERHLRIESAARAIIDITVSMKRNIDSCP
jgi:hypothetical protein